MNREVRTDSEVTAADGSIRQGGSYGKGENGKPARFPGGGGGRADPSPMAFTAHAHTRDRDYLRELGKAGIEIFFLICDPDWLYEGAFDQLMEDARVLCEEVPAAKIFLRLGVHPSVQWIRDHPDEMMRYQDGTVIPAVVGTESYTGSYPGMYALYSAAWREEAEKHVIGFLRDLKKTPLAEHFIGVFLAGGNTSEWYPSTPLTIHKGAPLGYSWLGVTDTADRDLYADFSPAFRQAFSAYLYDRYGSEEALRRAWRDPEADIDDPRIPDMGERAFIDADEMVSHFSSSGAWRADKSDNHVGSFLNTDKYQCTADFFQAFHVGAADSIIHFARAVKEYDRRAESHQAESPPGGEDRAVHLRTDGPSDQGRLLAVPGQPDHRGMAPLRLRG